MSRLQKVYISALTILSVAPFVASAQATTIGTLVTQTTSLLNGQIIPLLFVLAAVFFLYGVIRFILKAGDEAEQAKARGMILWSIVALAATITLFALARLVGNYIGGSTTIPSGF